MTRGLLLVALELTIIRASWTFGFDYSQFILAGVIWMLGWCMVLLAGLVFLPTRAVAAIGLLVIAGQSAFGMAGGLLPASLRPVWEFVYPIGAEVTPLQDSDPAPEEIPSDLPGRTRDIQGEYGTFRVSCEGPYAAGLRVEANKAAGWSVLSYEQGPDDDVDAVFTRPGRSVEVEVYCNQGVPTVGDVERATFIDED